MFPVVPAGGRKPKSLPAFIIASNGIFLRKESALGVTQTRVSNVAHLPELQPTLEYKLPPVPKKLSAKIAGFLLRAHKEFDSEAAVLLCLDKKRNWRIVIPRQDASGVDVKYFVDPDTVPKGWLLAGTVHSHPFNKTTAPTASWTDESDERKIDGVHLVAGSLDHNPKYGAAVVVDGTRFKYLNWEDLIEPAEPRVDLIPDDWLDKIENKKKKGVIGKAVSVITSYGSGYVSKPYTPEWMPRGNETPQEAIARARKHSFDWINEDANKLGYRLVWSLEELPEGPVVEADEKVKSISGGPKNDTVIVGGPLVPVPTTTPPATTKQQDAWDEDFGHTLWPVPAEQPVGPIWRDAEPIRCEDKHPWKECPKKGCGCHCEPCRKHLVGSYDASKVNPPLPDPDAPSAVRFGDEGWVGRNPDKDECACTECYGGCFAYIKPDDIRDDRLCRFCVRGEHYLEDGTTSKPKEDAYL